MVLDSATGSTTLPPRTTLSPSAQPDPRRTGRPDDVCVHCWGTIFAENFGLRGMAVYSLAGEMLVGGYTFSLSLGDLLACKEKNCVWYRCLCDRGIFDEMLEWFKNPENVWMHLTVGRPGQTEETTEEPTEPVETEEIIVVVNENRAFEVSTGADNPAAAWINAWAGTLRVPTVDLWGFVNASIEECVREHKTCQNFSDWSRPEASLPTRLIDCSDPLRPRILETTGLDPHTEYVALSYVWGGEQPNRMTVKNLSAYMEGIDPTLLPKTIVDAIQITHALGIRYLWTDSLCIVQDSREDKHRELSKMRNVYVQAFLTIDAAIAENASRGILHDPESVSTVAVEASAWLPFAWSRQHTQSPQRFMDLFEGVPGADLISLNSSSPRTLAERTRGYTGRRAWCLQEMLMTGRRLRFTELVHFRCRSSHHQNPGSYSSSDTLLGTEGIPDFVFHPTPSVILGTRNGFAIHVAWVQVVEDYTQRSLSYPEDKLVACAGLAETFGHALGFRTDYLAGLWRNSLLVDLLWMEPNAPIASGTRGRGDACAPSWSWAASGHPVWFPKGLYDDTRRRVRVELSEVVECAVTPDDPALPFGRVVAGSHIILRAPLLGPYNTEHLRSQLNEDDRYLWLDGSYRRDQEMPADAPLWVVPLIYVTSDAQMKWLVACIVVQRHSGELDVANANAVLEGPLCVYRRVGCCIFGHRDEAPGTDFTNELVDSLKARVDEQWDFPRTTIKLV